MSQELLAPIKAFLGCETPQSWLQFATQDIETLLIDHANCEKKAAATALNLLFRYVERKELLTNLSQLAREELLHFEQVCEYMENMGIPYKHVPSSRYASSLRKQVRNEEPYRLVDILIIGAFIEARSCERFAALAPLLETQPETQELARYYRFLLKSESRHFEDYLALATQYFPDTEADLHARIAEIRECERELIESEDTEFRFHSGSPAPALRAGI
ncbi:Probably tRNA-(MS[2]IO[6]A)-hydroxylase [gamma proteobacterium HdN1]|uniref:Probably tRNA-(MS[2]IO[6]A)-hydroxylase n=2 Tax=gamma proteobacterium HdN1 TaxID=83406 RepID=A0ACD6B9H9_9GAMM|nr:Probably tRNA-(MS[2]IO[6]A)-hydroxylase [gamma proteobacterium HdN1]